MKRGIEKRAHRTLGNTARDARAARDAIDTTVADLTAQLRMALQLVADLSADRRADIDRLRRIVACDSLTSAKRIARNRLDSLI